MVETIALGTALGLMVTLIVSLRRHRPPPVQTIASLRPGWAEIRGRVRAGARSRANSKAPISGREGLGWRVIIEQESGVRGWETVFEHCEFADFEVEDASGSIVVRAAGAPLVLDVAERRGRGGPFAPPPVAVERLIARRAHSRGVLFHKGFRWREWVLEEQREVIVRARVVSEVSEEPQGYRKLGHTLVLAGGTSRPIEVVE